MGTTIDPAALLERHASGEIDRNELLAELSSSDPKLGLMARLLAQRETADSEPDDAEQTASEARIEDAARMTDDARRLADAVRREFDDIATEVGSIRERLDMIASALGACPGCWGEDPSCRWCRGRGVPGSLIPDPEAFARLVLPAVRVQAMFRRRDAINDQPQIQERRTA